MLMLTNPSPWLLTVLSQLETSLVGYWTLGEASSTRSDSIGSNHLTPTGSVGQVTGKQGNAASFVRSSAQYLSIADNAALSTGDIDFAVGLWVRMSSKPSGAADMTAVCKWDYGSTQREFQIGYNGTQDRFNFSVSSNGTTQTHLYATALGSPAINTWYYILTWHDSVANTINIQVNGGAVTSAAYSAGVLNSTAPFTVGAMNVVSAVDNAWDGYIDEVSMWKRALTTLEGATLWNRGAGVTWSLPTTMAAYAYQLDEQFSTAMAGPLAATINADPGPGQWTVVNTGTSKFSISGGQLVVNGTFASGDRLTSASIARAAGRAFLWRVPTRTTTNTATRAGWFSSAASTTPELGIQYTSTPSDIVVRVSGVTLYTYTLGSGEHHFAAVMRASGGFVFGRNGTSGDYKLLWVSNPTSSAQFAKPIVLSGTNSTNIVVDDARITDLGGNFATDYGIATSRVGGSVASGTSATSTADALIEVSFTFDGTQRDLWVSRVDANNGYIWRVTTAGDLQLVKVTSGVEAVQSTNTAVFTTTTAYRLVIVQEGTTMFTALVNNVTITNTTRPSYSTATGVYYSGGSASDLVCWPRTVDLQGA